MQEQRMEKSKKVQVFPIWTGKKLNEISNWSNGMASREHTLYIFLVYCQNHDFL